LIFFLQENVVTCVTHFTSCSAACTVSTLEPRGHAGDLKGCRPLWTQPCERSCGREDLAETPALGRVRGRALIMLSMSFWQREAEKVELANIVARHHAFGWPTHNIVRAHSNVCERGQLGYAFEFPHFQRFVDRS
jgi:hypothetical protein